MTNQNIENFKSNIEDYLDLDSDANTIISYTTLLSFFMLFSLLIITLIIYFYYSTEIYLYLFTNHYNKKHIIKKANKINIKTYNIHKKLFQYIPESDNNIETYKKNLAIKLSHLIHNINDSIDYYLSLNNPDYSLIDYMKQYKNIIENIKIDKLNEQDYKLFQQKLELINYNINKKINI